MRAQVYNLRRIHRKRRRAAGSATRGSYCNSARISACCIVPVICVLVTVKLVSAVPLMVALVAPLKRVPVIVTVVPTQPPPVTEVTVGVDTL